MTSVYPCRSRVSLAKEDLVSEAMHAHIQLVGIRKTVSLAKEGLASETMHAHMQLVAIPYLSR